MLLEINLSIIKIQLCPPARGKTAPLATSIERPPRLINRRRRIATAAGRGGQLVHRERRAPLRFTQQQIVQVDI